MPLSMSAGVESYQLVAVCGAAAESGEGAAAVISAVWKLFVDCGINWKSLR